MTGKKIIANLLLLLSITGLNGYFSGVQAVLSDDELGTIRRIEDERHDPRYKATLISCITEEIRSKKNTNIEFYYESVLYKLSGGSSDIRSINFDDKTLYEKEFFATLIYRMLGYKINNKIPLSAQELSCISDFLTQKVKDFGNFNDMDKLNITRICLMCSEHDVLDRSILNGVLEIIRSFIDTSQVSPKLLITYARIPGPQQSTVGVQYLNKAIRALPVGNPQRIEALISLGKIPHNTDEQIKALNKAIGELPANDPQRIEALMALGKIPDMDVSKRIGALKEAIRILDKLGKAADDPQRIEALIALSKIPGPQQSTVGVECLNEVIKRLPANDPQRIDALIALGKIPGPQQSTIGVKYLNEAIEILDKLGKAENDPQRIEALIALGKIPHNTDNQIKALNRVIGALPVGNPQRIDALIALGKIPHNTDNQIKALNRAIGELPANDPQRIEALIALSKIPGPQQSTVGVECLNEVIKRLPESDPRRIEALIALGKIPGPQQSTVGVECLNEAIEILPERDPQRIDALIALGKIPHARYREIQALEEAIEILDKLGKAENDPQLIDALIALGKIPHDRYREIQALERAIKILDKLGKAENDPQRIDSLIALGKIPHNTDNQIKALNIVIEALPVGNPQRIDALIALAQIPRLNINKKIDALEELTGLQDPKLAPKIERIVNNIFKFGRRSLTYKECAKLNRIKTRAKMPRISCT